MAITGVKERRSHRYTFRYEDGQPLPSQDLTRSFWVYSDTVDENPDTVRTASFGGTSIPTYGDAHPSIAAAIAQDFDIERDEEYTNRWVVNVTYASRRIRGSSDGTGDSNQDPTLRTRLTVSTVQGERVLTHDREGTAIKLPSGELFIYKCAWNELQLDFVQYRSILDTTAYIQLAKYRNAINSDWWRGFAPKTARIVSIRGQDADINGATYLERQISIQLRDPSDTQQPSWDEKILNAGFYTYDVLSDELTPVRDSKTGDLVTKPQRIAANGRRVLDPGEPDHFIDVKAYPLLPFSALNL